ncbi:MAG: nicotinate (nicotinamide) nucleotide adenylyltransferase [Porphyromonas sp.]|nr:nicotinate (nicotinamide) nucleotide adenylyltransferase [Porphyromonas sp.]
MKDKTILFPGSFNPMHIGHLALANYICECMDEVKELWFMVSPHNPLKEQNDLLPDELRKSWVQKAIEGYPRFKLSLIEDSLSRPSYTLHTIRALKQLHPKRQFVLLVGSDNLEQLPRWYGISELLAEVEIWVYPRPGYSNRLPDALSELPHRIRLIDAPLMEISSTFVRESIRKDLCIPYFLPATIPVELFEQVVSWLKRG